MARNILEIVHLISEDSIFTPWQNLTKIAQISKGFAPMLTEILEDYIEQNSGTELPSSIARIKAREADAGRTMRTG